MSISTIGDSYYLLLGKKIKEELELKPGTVIGYKLWNIIVKNITCPNCKYEFEDDEGNDPHDCPGCGHEFIDALLIENSYKEVENNE